MRPTAAVLAAFALPVAAFAATPAPPAPVFPPAAVVDTIQGVAVPDPYRALENGADPAVEAWSDAQNARTRAYLDNLPGREAVSAKLRRLTGAASPAFIDLKARGSHVFALYADPANQQPVLVRMNARAEPDSRKPVLDPNKLDISGHTAIDWYAPSPDGTKVAASLSRNGSEDGVLHVYDVASGKEIGAPIPRVQYPTAGGSLAWTADGSAFWYTRYPDESAPEGERHFNQQAYFHRVGTDWRQDPVALSAADGLPRTAEIFLDNSEGAPAALAAVQLGDGGEWQHYLLRPGQKPLQIARYEDRVVAATVARDGTVYGVSRLGAPMGRVLKLAAPYTGGFAAAPVFVPESSDAAIIDGGSTGVPLVVSGDRLFVSRIAGGPSQVSVYDRAGKGSPLAIPAISEVTEIDPLRDGQVLFRVATYTEPPFFSRWSASGGVSPARELAMTSPVSFADAEVRRVFATSKDGTKVPLNIIARKGLKLDGSNPVLLYAYGGYGISQTPGFLGAFRRLWLDAGGVYVVANLRGGGEYGQAWREQGRLSAKQNVFDDFAASAQWLIDNRYTRSDKLAIMGGSNGGLLMGVTLVQHPDLARAVVSSVGIYDMIRYELDPNGAFNVAEYGSVSDPAQFRVLSAYSPYHHVAKGVGYPAVLMLTGANDGRVNPLNSRKFAAALQAATSSDRPILLRTSKTSGHGHGSSLEDRISEQADELMFLYDQLGVTPPAN